LQPLAISELAKVLWEHVVGVRKTLWYGKYIVQIGS